MTGSQPGGPIVITGMHGSFVDAAGVVVEGLGVDIHRAEGAGILDLQRRMAQETVGSEQGWIMDGEWSPPVDYRRLAPFGPEASSLLSEQAAGRRWGWSDPRTALWLDWWDERVEDAIYLFVYRPPWDVLAAIAGGPGGGPGPVAVLKTWTAYNEMLLTFHDQHADRCVLVEGGGFISDPALVLLALEGLVGPLDAGGRDSAAQAWRNVAPVVDRRRSHRRADEEPVHKLLDTLPVDARLILGEFDRRAAARDDRARPPVASLVPNPPVGPATSSVVITCRNHGALLLDSLAGVRCCREEALETVVVDHGSTDRQTIDLLDAVEAAGVSVVRIAPSDVAAACNAGITATISQLVVCLTAGDLLRPGFVTAAAAGFDLDPKLAAVQGNIQWFGEGVGASWVDAFGCGVMRRDALTANGGFDERLSAPGLEYLDLLLSLEPQRWRVGTIDVPAVDRRMSSLGTYPLMKMVIEKHRWEMSRSDAPLYLDLLKAADAAVGTAYAERDLARAAHDEVRASGAQAGARYQEQLADAAGRMVALETVLAAGARRERFLEQRIDELTDEVLRREHDAESARTRLAEEHAARRAELTHRESLAREVEAIHATKLWRWTVRPRSVYGILRRFQR